MKKNGTQLYRYTDLIQNNKKKVKYLNSKDTNKTMNFNFSKNKNKALSNYSIYKNYKIPTNDSKDTSYRNKELYKSDMPSVSQEKTLFEDSVKSGVNFLRKLSAKNIRTKVFDLNKCDKKNNANIIHRINIPLNKKRKIDFIKYKLLLAQKNYEKKLFQYNNVDSSSYYSKNINPCLRKNRKRHYFDFDKFKKIFFEQGDINAHSMKDENENFSISSFKGFKNSHNKKNIFETVNYSHIKNTNNNNTLKSFKKSKESLLDYKRIIPIKKNNLFERAKKIIKIKNHQEHKENIYCNKSSGHLKIIDDNYKEYLKDISSSNSNKSKRKEKNKNESLENKNEIFRRIKIINKPKYSNLLEFSKITSDRRKILNENNKTIIKTIIIENPFLRKKY